MERAPDWAADVETEMAHLDQVVADVLAFTRERAAGLSPTITVMGPAPQGALAAALTMTVLLDALAKAIVEHPSSGSRAGLATSIQIAQSQVWQLATMRAMQRQMAGG